MTLQETLDTLKRNGLGQLYRKDRNTVFHTGNGTDFRVGLVGLDDEGTIVVELVPDVESAEAVPEPSMAFANPALGD